MRHNRILSFIISTAICFTSLPAISGRTLAKTNEDQAYTRICGSNRYETSIYAAEELKEIYGTDKFDNIVVASGDNFPDALAGNYLAAKKNAPVILTSKNEKIYRETAEYITENLSDNGIVYLLGGTGAIPSDFREMLSDNNIRSKRIKGYDRYETDLAILKECGIEENAEILVATGNNFPDSLSASATGKPVLLVGKSLTEGQMAFLDTYKDKGISFVVLGGTGVVGNAVAEELSGYGDVTRIAGNNRYETAVLIAEYFYDKTETERINLVYGGNFPDGLSAGALAYATGSAILLTAGNTKANDTVTVYTDDLEDITGYILGGETLIPEWTAEAVYTREAETDPVSDPTDTPLPTPDIDPEDPTPTPTEDEGQTEDSDAPHTHTWEPVVEVIHHEETGHYEDVYNDWVEEIYYDKTFLGGYYDDIPDKYKDEIGSIWYPYIYEVRGTVSGYTLDEVTVLKGKKGNKSYYMCNADVVLDEDCMGFDGFIVWDMPTVNETCFKWYKNIEHHDYAGKEWVVDTQAWDEEVIVGYKCSCGEEKEA